MPREIGAREKALRAQREENMKKPRKPAARAVPGEPNRFRPEAPSAPPSAIPAEPRADPAKKESAMRKPRKAAKKAARAKPAKKIDRSPLAVGNYIVEAGEKGRTMAELAKKFGVEAHPMRAKIHSAKHDLGFTITYDAAAKRYTATAPAVAA